MVDEILQQIFSKFAIFLEYENPHSFFFSFRATLFFPWSMLTLDIDQGIH